MTATWLVYETLGGQEPKEIDYTRATSSWPDARAPASNHRFSLYMVSRHEARRSIKGGLGR
jgi:hypothetical protein